MSTRIRLNMLVMGYIPKEFSLRNKNYQYKPNVIIIKLLGNIFIDLANTALQIISQNDNSEELHDFYWAFDYLCEITTSDDTEYQIKPINIINSTSMTRLIQLLKHKNCHIHKKALQTILTMLGSPHETTLSEKQILMKVKELQKVITFTELLSKSENQTCISIHCYARNPQWASVNNGCFMCVKCAGIHRNMGVHISFVRSVTMDNWSKIQLARMKYGGNAILKQFWTDQQFPINLTPKQRFYNEAMDEYRQALLSMTKTNNISTINDIGFIGYTDRCEELNSNKCLPPKMQGFGNTNYNPNDNNDNSNDDTWKMFKTWGNSFVAKASAVSSVTNVMNGKTAETLSSWWSAATTSVTNVMNDGLNDNKNNDSVSLDINNENNHGKQKGKGKGTDGNSSDDLYAFVEKIENEDKDDKNQQVREKGK